MLDFYDNPMKFRFCYLHFKMKKLRLREGLNNMSKGIEILKEIRFRSFDMSITNCSINGSCYV